MEFFVLETPSSKKGLYSGIHFETFHGSCEAIPFFCSKREVDSERPSALPKIIRSGYFFPPVFGRHYLVVNESVKEILESKKRIRCHPVEYMRLVDFYFCKGDENYDEAYTLLIDSFRFLEYVNEMRLDASRFPRYFVVQSYSEQDIPIGLDAVEVHLEVMDSPHSRDAFKICPDDLDELGLINISYGHIVSAPLFHRLAPYLDQDMFTVGHWKDNSYKRWGGEMGQEVRWPQRAGRLGIGLMTRLKWRFFPED